MNDANDWLYTAICVFCRYEKILVLSGFTGKLMFSLSVHSGRPVYPSMQLQ
jgi:hypothetical protein